MAPFKPYNLRSVTRAAQGAVVPPIVSLVNIEAFVSDAVRREDQMFEDDATDDTEGIELSLRPPSPLTNSDSDSESEESEPNSSSKLGFTEDNAPPAPPPGGAEKARKRRRSKQKRKEKRIRKAHEIEHPAGVYTAKPRTVQSKLKDGEVYKISGDISNLPTTSGGSWIGKRQQGIGETPWEIPLLMKANFQYLKWNGM